MTKKHILGDFEKALLFGLIFSILISFANFNNDCETLRKNVLRLHIIANSDSKSDQEIKLKVRDAILSESGELFKNSDGLSASKRLAKNNLKSFENTANNVIKHKGYTAKAKIGKSYFNTRDYDTFSLPAGEYDSLIITLGEGKGHNWWCVIYPSVCIGGSRAKLKDSAGKSSAIAENPKKYKVKFKIVEIYEKLKRKRKR